MYFNIMYGVSFITRKSEAAILVNILMTGWNFIVNSPFGNSNSHSA